MKVIKKGLYIFTLVISLFIINTNIKAYDIQFDNDLIINEEYIYEKYLEVFPDFEIKEYSNFICLTNITGSSGKLLECYALNNYCLENFTYKVKNIFNSVSISLSETFDRNLCKHYYLNYYPSLSKNNKSAYSDYFERSGLTLSNSYSFINFNLTGLSESVDSLYNVLDFSSYLTEDEENIELEINIKATNLLNFMIDKTKNIYEVLISNEIFKFVLSIPLIYLCFLVISRIIKK